MCCYLHLQGGFSNLENGVKHNIRSRKHWQIITNVNELITISKLFFFWEIKIQNKFWLFQSNHICWFKLQNVDAIFGAIQYSWDWYARHMSMTYILPCVYALLLCLVSMSCGYVLCLCPVCHICETFQIFSSNKLINSPIICHPQWCLCRRKRWIFQVQE